MRVIVLQDGAMIADVTCGHEALYVGSKESARVHLPDAGIAPQQLVLFPGSAGWTVEQLNPEVEAFLNGARLTTSTALKTGDEIALPGYLLRIFPEFVEQPAERKAVSTTKQSLERFAQTQLPAGTVIKKEEEPVEIAQAALQRISELNVNVSQCTLAQELMDTMLDTLLTVFAAHRVWIGMRRVNYGPMEFVEGRLINGQSADLTELGENLKPRVLDRSQTILIPRIEKGGASVLTGPLIGPDGVLGMVYFDSGDSGRRFERHDLDLFILLCSVYAGQLDAIFKMIARNRGALIEGQVAVAHDIQSQLTPKKLPQWDGLQFGAFRETGRDQSGDIYDVVKLANNLAAFMVAHPNVTGSWPSMLMSQAHAAFRCACMHQDNPQIFFRQLNWLLYDAQDERTLDCFMAGLNPDTGEMRYAIAGDIGAYIINARGEERRLCGTEPTPPIGKKRTITYPLLSEHLESGETLVLFTRGVTTARNSREEVFGEERLVNLLCDGFGQQASAMLREMLSDLRAFTEGGIQPDDITVVLTHRV